MSFASEVKNEIYKTEYNKECCQIAELCGMFCFAGTVNYAKGDIYLKLTTESMAVLKRFITLTKRRLNIDVALDNKTKETRSGTVFTAVIKNNDDVILFLTKIGLRNDAGRNSFRIQEHIVFSKCCIRAFVKGAFMGSGSVVNPEKGYHLEFVTHHMNLSRDFLSLLKKAKFKAKISVRGTAYIIYFKNCDEIADLLAFTGAHKAMMDYTNTRIEKDTKNYINRTVNCETANLDKTAKAAADQIVAIEKLIKSGIMESLSRELKELALLRLENSQASLSEIADISKPKMSKSGISHRMRKLLEIASKIK